LKAVASPLHDAAFRNSGKRPADRESRVLKDGRLWTFRGKRIGVLGLSFKGGTDDIRDSPALDIVEQLLKEGSTVVAFDPAAMDRAKEVIPASERMRYVDDPYVAAQDADALVILSDWQEFGDLDLDRLHYTLRYPIVIDGRNLYDPAQMVERGFTYLSVGRPASHQTRDAVVHRLP
jgi:UDPglucose 6-dehydrogenase